jgi:hypothetical protein
MVPALLTCMLVRVGVATHPIVRASVLEMGGDEEV